MVYFSIQRKIYGGQKLCSKLFDRVGSKPCTPIKTSTFYGGSVKFPLIASAKWDNATLLPPSPVITHIPPKIAKTVSRKCT